MSVFENGPWRQELISRLKRELKLNATEIDDEELLSRMQETLSLARIELAMAFSSLRRELIAAMPKWLAKLLDATNGVEET